MKNQKITTITKAKPYLCWELKDKTLLSDESAFERILNYGEWEDVQDAIRILSFNKAKSIFLHLANKNRTNLRKKTINYFKYYFDRNAVY